MQDCVASFHVERAFVELAMADGTFPNALEGHEAEFASAVAVWHSS